MNLALKYRPKTFTDVVGQRATSAILSAMVQKNMLSQVLLFSGPSGVGKTSMARIVAAALNPETAEDVHNGVHPDVLEIDAASNGNVAAIRQLKSSLNYVSPGNRVVIIDEVHAMSAEAFDALLNMLEFPPPNVTFILCTTEAHNLEPAIRHRCDKYTFNKANLESLIERLQYVVAQEQINVSAELLELLASRSEGSYREALMLLEQVWVANITTVEEYNDLQGEIDYGPSLILASLGGPSMALNKLEDILRYTNAEEISDRIVEVLRDIMLLKGGIEIKFSGKALEDRQEINRKTSQAQLLKAIKIIWDLQTKLSSGDPIRGLEMATAMLGEIFQLAIAVPEAPKPDSGTMSINDMRAFKA